MKNFLFTIIVMTCAALTVNAQTSVETALKNAEKAAKLADKNPNNGKLQYEAAIAFFNDALGDKKDLDRAQMYAERAVKLAKEFPSPKDTLQGLSCWTLGMIHMQKNNTEEAMDYLEMAVDAFNVELGRRDPITNGSKLMFAYMAMTSSPMRGCPKVLEAFYDNEMAPQDKQIDNMAEANIMLETAMEFLLAQQTQLFRYALPLITYEGQKYLILETDDWSMERPLMGWMAPSLMDDDEEDDTPQGDQLVMVDEYLNFKVIKGEERHQVNMQSNFKHLMAKPTHLETNPDDSRIWFFDAEKYKELLNIYREFKAAENKTE
ncbi:MAG: hypothetical protein J6X27_01765 [Bacteroidaceae bacterium]|nr:hypothetical protein [Bacteroidaceae bacterium]